MKLGFIADTGTGCNSQYNVADGFTKLIKDKNIKLVLLGGDNFYENGCAHKNDNKFHKVDSTMTWCWQQGCRLQWFNKYKNSIILASAILMHKELIFFLLYLLETIVIKHLLLNI